MRRILKYLKEKYYAIIQSIAFYPVLISIGFFTLAIMGVRAENWQVVSAIKENVPYIFIQDYETARAILSTLIGGILSLTVFSFSMVMLVLNQASANFSPRLLPNLISNKRHQIILGFYVGTLLYCIIILISLGAYGVDSNNMGLSTMIAAISGVLCVALFVYFIHGISGAILIHNIVNRLFKTSSDYFQNEYDKQIEGSVQLRSTDTSEWTIIKSSKTGYFRSFDRSLLTTALREQKNQIEIIPYTNEHLWKGTPFIRVKENISDTELENLLLCSSISYNRHEGEKGLSGMIKLMEIAVKAMSPGINDPGTAISVINKLGDLCRMVLAFSLKISTALERDGIVIIENNISAKELMRLVIQPIRLYSKKDSAVLFELIRSLQFIKSGPNISENNIVVLNTELMALKEDIEANVENQMDKTQLLQLFQEA